MPHFCAESKNLNISNITDCINQRIIANSVGVAKPMKRWTYCIWKWSEVNCVHTHSNIPIVEMTTKQTPICICSGSIGSTVNGIRKNTLRSVKTGQSQFILLGIVTHNDLQQLKIFFSECLQKFSDYQHYSRGPVVLRHYLPSRTLIVNYLYNSKLY